MSLSSTRQFVLLFRHLAKLELSNLEKIFTPALFALTTLLMFAFVFGGMDAATQLKLGVAETFLTVFLALQISFTRTFEHECQDKAFDLLRIYPIKAEMWFLAKYFVTLIFSTLVLASTMLISAVLLQSSSSLLLPDGVYFVAFLALVGMCAVGVLLSALIMRANTKQVLYPILYFPIVTPLLIASVQASLKIVLDGATVVDLFSNWLGLVVIFDVIYFTLAMLLFGELLKAD